MNPPTDTPDAFASAALNLADCGFIMLDADLRIMLWNRWMGSRSGKAASRVRGHSLVSVFPELNGSRVEAAIHAALTDGTSTSVPQSLHKAPFPLRPAGSFDGDRIDQAVSVVPHKQGKDAYCLIEIRDISDVIDRERQLLVHAESLRTRSHVDALTGINNRGYFDIALDRELRRAQRSKGDLALLLMDIDSFKAYNDFFGHQQGDTCLVTVAQAFASMLKRPADIAARYGGEEFAAVLPDTTAEQACAVANAIRLHVAALALPHSPAANRPHVTLSIGVAGCKNGQAIDSKALIEAADKALYAAKRGGRNRVVLEGEEPPQGGAGGL